jgi:hypothetical protein
MRSTNRLNFVTFGLQKVGSFGAPMPHGGTDSQNFIFLMLTNPSSINPKILMAVCRKQIWGERPPKRGPTPQILFLPNFP